MTDFDVAILGLGHIGFPTAVLLANTGFRVIGVDIDESKLQMINDCQFPFFEPGLKELVCNVINHKLFTSSDGECACRNSNVMIIIVPTPTNDKKNSDLSAVISASETISKGIKKNDLVIIESTVPPGTCDNVIIPILEKSGLKAGEDFKVAFSPERAIPGNTIYEMSHNSRVIGGIDPESAEMASEIYSKITDGGIIKLGDLISAETVKLVENTYRDINIAFANEIAIICEKLNIDAIDIIEAANYHPRVNVHIPGPGVGGHCLPIDPYFLVEIAKKNGLKASLITMARDINGSMPEHVIKLTEIALRDVDKTINGSTIGILGFAYKGNVADVRETPAIPIITKLLDQGASIFVNDPFVNDRIIESNGVHVSSLEDVCNCDCVILVTDHDQYKMITPDMIKNNVLVCTRPIIDPEQFINKGVVFKGIGRS